MGGRCHEVVRRRGRLEKGGEADRQPWLKPRRQRQQFGVAPHGRGTLPNALSASLRLVNRALGQRIPDRVIVVGNLQRRETVVADRARLVAPASFAFPAAQFVVRLTVVIRHEATRFLSAANSWGRAGKKCPKNKKASFSRKKGKEVGMQIKLSFASESHVPRFRAGVGTWRSGYMIPIRLPWRHRARPSSTLHEIPTFPLTATLLLILHRRLTPPSNIL